MKNNIFQTSDQIHKLVAPDGSTDDLFGCSVAVYDDVIAVGAKGDDDNGSSSGSVDLFNLTTGDHIRKLTASNADASTYFIFSQKTFFM